MTETRLERLRGLLAGTGYDPQALTLMLALVELPDREDLMAPRKSQDPPLVKAAKDAIKAVASDRSVGPAMIVGRLEMLRNEIEIALEKLEEADE